MSRAQMPNNSTRYAIYNPAPDMRFVISQFGMLVVVFQNFSGLLRAFGVGWTEGNGRN
jgi:hypothetical protein